MSEEAFMSLNGSRAISGRVTVPRYGAWTGELVLASSTAIDPSPAGISIVVGDLTLKKGTARRMANFAGSQSALVSAGAGWRKVLPARGYSHEAGVLLSTVLGDAAREAGESLTLAGNATIGTSFARRSDVAERVLRRFLAGRWWIDTDGATRADDRDASPITSPFTIEHWSGSKGRFAVATEAYADWLPGRTFTAPTVTTPQTIASVSFTADNDGKVRLDVLTSDTAEDRLQSQMRAVIRDEVADLTYAGTFAYRVAANSGTGRVAIDVTSEDSRMPAMLRVPLAPELGVIAAPMAGTRCRLRFANGDPGRAEIVALGESTEHAISAESCALLVYNSLAALMAAAGGGPLTAITLAPLLAAAVTTALTAQGVAAPAGAVAQAAAATAEAALFAAGAPASTSAPFNAAIASALAAKALNVTGLFPSLGVPFNG